MGAGDGLVRYDGQSFQTFTQEDGIAEDFATVSFVDASGRIWFGHNSGGITVMDSGKFKVLELSDEIISRVTGISQDKNGYIWVSTQRSGIIKFNSSLEPEYLKEAFKNMFLFAMEILPDGKLLLGTSEGLKVFKVSSTGTPVMDYSVTETELTTIECISPSQAGNSWWIGTEDEGFYQFTPGKTANDYQIKRFGPDQGFSASKVPVIFEDLNQHIWVGTSGEGFKKYGRTGQGDEFREIVPLHAADSLYLQDIIASIYQDRFGQIWLGTYGSGLISMVEEMFVLYRPQAGEVFDDIISVIEDSKGNLWFGTGNGLYRVNSEIMQDHGFNFTASNGMPLITQTRFGAANGLPEDKINALYEDKKGTIWVGTETQGIFLLNPETGTSDSLFLSQLSLSKSINVIDGDKDGNIWIGTKGGIYIYNPATEEKRYYNTRNGLAHNNIHDIFTDSKGMVWVAAHSNRVSVYNGKTFEVFPKSSEINIPNIFAVTEDVNGDIWLATDGGGLYQFHDSTYKQYTVDSGLVAGYCYHVIPDAENNIWTTHRTGLSRFILNTGAVIPFDNKGEFPLEETTMNAVFKDKNGNLWFGTQHGVIKYNRFYDQFEALKPNTRITGFYDLDNSRLLADGAALDYNKYRLEIDFLGLTFVNQPFVKYKYRLNDLGWSEITSRTSVTYEGLGEGDYVFQVLAMNKQGLWNEEPVELSFSIAPPFWKTWWFRGLGLLVIAGILFGYVRYRTYVLNKEKEILEEKVQERTSELEAEKEKVNRMNEKLEEKVEERTAQLADANQALENEKEELKRTAQLLADTNQELDTFIYRASHDLKNPLASLVGLIEIAGSEVTDPVASQYFMLLEKSSKRLDGVLEDLIEATRIKQAEIKPRDIDLVTLTQDIFKELSDMEGFSKMALDITPPDTFPAVTDRTILHAILFNFIKNAILFRDDTKERPHLNISFRKTDAGFLRVQARDNGMGVPDKIKPKVFDMFFRGSEKSTGSGLGLYTVRTAADKVGGKVGMESTEGEGALFWADVPWEIEG